MLRITQATHCQPEMALLMRLLGLLRSGTTAGSPICTQCLRCSLSFAVDAA